MPCRVLWYVPYGLIASAVIPNGKAGTTGSNHTISTYVLLPVDGKVAAILRVLGIISVSLSLPAPPKGLQDDTHVTFSTKRADAQRKFCGRVL